MANKHIYRPHSVTGYDCELYISDFKNHVLWKYNTTSGKRTVFAGTLGEVGDEMGDVDSSLLTAPTGLYSNQDSLYAVSNTASIIYKINMSTKQIEHWAGQHSIVGSADNANGLLATFKNPNKICGNSYSIFVSDSGNHTIRKINKLTQEVTTLAGTAGVTGSSDGAGLSSTFNSPQGCVANNEFLYVSDYNNHTIRKIDLNTETVTTLTGLAGSSGSVNGDLSSTRFYNPTDLWLNNNLLYVADYTNQLIRQINLSTHQVTILLSNHALYFA
jgi:hypothetical protein